jgi:hypothetical protein
MFRLFALRIHNLMRPDLPAQHSDWPRPVACLSRNCLDRRQRAMA